MEINPVTINELDAIVRLAKTTFRESHGHSAPEEDLEKYIERNFTRDNFRKEIEDPKNVFYLLRDNNEIIGYSKIIFNMPINAIEEPSITKLERIYFLEKFHGKGYAKQLFDFNVAVAKENKQKGIWLYVWVENNRAIEFYKKQGFEIVGRHDFKISERHVNPNHQLYLKF